MSDARLSTGMREEGSSGGWRHPCRLDGALNACLEGDSGKQKHLLRKFGFTLGHCKENGWKVQRAS